MSPTQREASTPPPVPAPSARRPSKIGAAGEGQVEEAQVLERLPDDHVEHGPVARVRKRVDAGTPLVDEALRGLPIALDSPPLGGCAFAGSLGCPARHALVELTLQVEDGVGASAGACLRGR